MANVVPALKNAHNYIFGWGWYLVGLLSYRIIEDRTEIYFFAITVTLIMFLAQKYARSKYSYKLDFSGWIIAIVLIPIAIDPFDFVRVVDYIALTILLDAFMDLFGKKKP
ncbi:hypothetical protein KC571_00005, partial [candidate division WWE3 bacterium]|nr:hypothetical protein [candidate division WWE3 bacterium]